MAKDLNCSVSELIQNETVRGKINLKKYLSDSVGLPTLNDIMAELAKPGRDPRKAFTVFQFTEGVNTIEDLYPEMLLPGIVTNVTRYDYSYPRYTYFSKGGVSLILTQRVVIDIQSYF